MPVCYFSLMMPASGFVVVVLVLIKIFGVVYILWHSSSPTKYHCRNCNIVTAAAVSQTVRL
jgi:hypothetical protein